MKKTLVTGANGFIGSHLAEGLLRDGESVKGLIHTEDDSPPFRKDGVEWVRGDLRRPSSLEDAVEGCGTVFHAAALSRYNALLPEEDYRSVNVEGTRALMECCLRRGVGRFVFISTIEAVGVSKDGAPLTEATVPHPRNVYGRSKLEAEDLVRRYVRERGLNAVIVRIGMTYGPREKIVFRRFFKPISKGFYVRFGDGSALLEFAYVKNQVEGLRRAAEKGRAGETYFVSDVRSYSFEEVVRAIAAGMGVSVKLISFPRFVWTWIALGFEGISRVLPFYPFYIKETGRPPFSRRTLEWVFKDAVFCDISKAREELGYSPAYGLEEGLKETLQWYRREGWL